MPKQTQYLGEFLPTILFISFFFRQTVDPQPQVTPSHQLKIDTLLNKNETYTHVVKATPSNNLKTDILAESPTSEVSDSEVNIQCCGQVSYSDDIGDDVIDCLFDDIDYLDKFFELEPLPSATESHHYGTSVELNSESGAIVISHDDNDDVIDLSSSSSGK